MPSRPNEDNKYEMWRKKNLPGSFPVSSPTNNSEKDEMQFKSFAGVCCGLCELSLSSLLLKLGNNLKPVTV